MRVADIPMPTPRSHQVELDKRLERHTKQPGKLLRLEELQRRIEIRK